MSEIDQMRNALEFYADPDGDGYRVDVTDYGLSTEEGEIVRDGGRRAREALATVAAANDEGVQSARMRVAIDAGLKAFCSDTSDFTMSSAMRRAAADFIMGEPGMFPLATSRSQHEGAGR